MRKALIIACVLSLTLAALLGLLWNAHDKLLEDHAKLNEKFVVERNVGSQCIGGLNKAMNSIETANGIIDQCAIVLTPRQERTIKVPKTVKAKKMVYDGREFVGMGGP